MHIQYVPQCTPNGPSTLASASLVCIEFDATEMRRMKRIYYMHILTISFSTEAEL